MPTSQKPSILEASIRRALRRLPGAIALVPVAAFAQTPAGGAELEAVVVTGSQVELVGEYAGGQVARGGRVGMFGNLDMMDTPFSSTNYTADLMLDQQAKSVADVLLNDPTVRVARGFGNFQELFVIRGFPAFSDDMTYNGIYGILPRQYVASEFLERVELFRGANAFLNGAAPGGSGLGGLVNLVPKRAGSDPLTRLTVGMENDSQAYLGVDVGRRFGATGLRFNAARRDGETSVHDQDRELTVLSVGIDYEGERARLTADLGYQDHIIDAPRPSVTPFGGIPSPPSADGNFAQPWTYTDEEQLFGVVRAEFDIGDNAAFWVAAGMREGDEANVLSNPNSAADGSTTAYRFDNAREDSIVSGDIGIRGEFSTGSVGHRIIASASYFSFDSNNAYAFSDFFNPFAGDLYDPVDVAPPPANFFTGGSLSNPLKTLSTDTQSVALADIVSFMDDRLLVTIGLRDQQIETASYNYNTGVREFRYDESKTTPVGGVVFKPADAWAVYANYIEGLVPGDVAPATSGGLPVTNAGEVLKPYQTEQFEVGVKYDNGSFGGVLSAFELSKPSGIVVNQTFSASGEQQNRGIELSAFGAPGEHVRLIGGLTWIDAELTRTQGGALDGRTPVGNPDLQLNVNVEFDVPAVEGLTLDARAIHTSSQFADSANTVRVPSWNRFDIGGQYATEIGGKDVTIRLRVDNVTDENEWVSVGGYPGSNYLVLGNPRTFILSVSTDF